MPFYFCTGIDRRFNGRRDSIYPRLGLTPGANWIWLDRSPKTALLWLPTAVSDPDLFPIALDKEEVLTTRTKDDLAARMSAPKTLESRLDLVVAEYLMTPPSGRWNALRGSSLQGRYTVWLGPGGNGRNLLWSASRSKRTATKSYEDTFTRTGNLDGSTSSDGLFTWSEVQGTNLTVANDQVESVGTGQYNVALPSADTDTDDNFAEADFAGLTTGQDNSCEVGARMQNGTGGSEGYYFSITHTGLPSVTRELRQFDDDTAVGSSDSVSTTSGHMRIEVDGDQITGLVDLSITHGPFTSTAFTGHLRGSLHMWDDSANAHTMDNFKYGDLVAGGQTVAVGLATETDLSQAIGKLKAKTIGLVTETDLSQSIGRLKSRALGLVTESDTAQPINWAPIHRLLSQVSETDLAQVITLKTGVLLGQAVESDQAFDILWSPKHRLVTLASEGDIALPITVEGGGGALAGWLVIKRKKY